MELPPELTRVPTESLDMLRFLGRESVQAADAASLIANTGMSERRVMKGIRGLVTKGYLIMDDTYTYYLTEKGSQAIEDVLAYDDANPSGTAPAAKSTVLVEQDLVIVLPSPIGMQETATLQIGLVELPPVSHETHLILRLSATLGLISPAEVTLTINPNQPMEPQEAYYNPTGQIGPIRIRVEVLQVTDVTEVHPAGGMFFDVQVAPNSGGLQAWYGQVMLQVVV